MAEQAGGLFEPAQHDLGHAVVQQLGDGGHIGLAQFTADIEGSTALQALDVLQAAVVGDVAGLARPGRDGAETRHDQEQATAGLLYRHARAVLEQAREHMLLVGTQLAVNLGEMGEFSVQTTNSGDFLAQLLE